MLKRAANLLTTAYLLLMFCVYPFYMERGYENIGEAKNRFFLYVSLAAFGVLIFPAVIGMGRRLRELKRGQRAYLVNWDRVSSTDLFVLLFATAVFLSYVFTDYREEALWGTEGWYIGTVPLLLLCGLYFFISRMWNGKISILYFPVAASGLVFLLGLCNRFSFYPIPFETVSPDFISTLGNINWYCGYLSVTAPVGIGLFVLEEEGNTLFGRKKCLLGIYALITFMSAFGQGSSSVFLWFFALFFVLLWIGVGEKRWLQNLIMLIVIWGVSAQLVRLLRHLLPGRYNYDVDNLCGYCTDSSATLWIAAAAVAAVTVMLRALGTGEAARRNAGRIRKLLLTALLFLLMALLFLSLFVTKYGGFEALGSVAAAKLFFLDEEWGNGRGATLLTGVRLFREMPFLHKLFGVGADCFSTYAYSLPEVAAYLRNYFGGSRLTNAHNELLTMLVNIGAVGALSFTGIFVFFVANGVRQGKKDASLYLFAVCAVCYFVHNMVSFSQVLNIPFLFLFLGMGEARRYRG